METKHLKCNGFIIEAGNDFAGIYFQVGCHKFCTLRAAFTAIQSLNLKIDAFTF